MKRTGLSKCTIARILKYYNNPGVIKQLAKRTQFSKLNDDARVLISTLVK